jgi:hypothetical protein
MDSAGSMGVVEVSVLVGEVVVVFGVAVVGVVRAE